VSRAKELRSQHDAEVAVAELEEELVRLKGLKKPDEAKLREVKNDLRAARQRFRELRAGQPTPEGNGVASPATIEATARAEQPGGGS
jgi:hypothetical protein